MSPAVDGILHAWLFWAAAPAGALILVAWSMLRAASLADDEDLTRPCRCHHCLSLHQHLRGGLDCALCDCRGFVAADVHHARTAPLPSRVGEHVTDVGEEQLFDQDADDWTQWTDELSAS